MEPDNDPDALVMGGQGRSSAVTVREVLFGLFMFAAGFACAWLGLR